MQLRARLRFSGIGISITLRGPTNPNSVRCYPSKLAAWSLTLYMQLHKLELLTGVFISLPTTEVAAYVHVCPNSYCNQFIHAKCNW